MIPFEFQPPSLKSVIRNYASTYFAGQSVCLRMLAIPAPWSPTAVCGLVYVNLLPKTASEAGDAAVCVVYLQAKLSNDADSVDIYVDDMTVSGIYEVHVPSDLHDAHRANCAMDGFQSTVPIKNLDTFEFTLWDGCTGQELVPDYDLGGYALADRCRCVKLLHQLRN